MMRVARQVRQVGILNSEITREMFKQLEDLVLRGLGVFLALQVGLGFSFISV